MLEDIIKNGVVLLLRLCRFIPIYSGLVLAAYS